MRRALLLSATLLASLSQSGCVERLLAIHSDPPGAAVYVDGERVGTTPCEVNYTWYGTRLVVLELRGFSLIHQEVVLNAPWWQMIPIDFITDVLIPITIRDRYSVSYTLEPAAVSTQESDAVYERAMELKKRSSQPQPKE